MQSSWFWIPCLVLVAGAVGAEPTPAKRLTLQPMATPSPALKYRLLPTLAEQTPGNAAFEYYRACSAELLSHRSAEMSKKIHAWLEPPPSQLPRKEMDWILRYRPLQAIDQGARREYVDWQMTGRLRQEGAGLRTPELQELRDFANLLKLRAGLEVAGGQYDQAVYSLETGFALARHLGEVPTLISGLVGIAIASQVAHQLETLIQSPNSPNLYWALTNLPRPLVSLRKPFQGDNLTLEKEIPLPKGLEARAVSPAEARALMNQLTRLIQGIDGVPADLPSPQVELAAAALVVKSYTPAKHFLIGRGLDAARVEAMPAPQVVFLAARLQFDQMHDDLHKWLHLPYWEAQPGLARTLEDFAAARSSMEAGPMLAATFLSSADKVLLAQARLERQLAALRVVEALRLHAAAHDGQLPAALRDVTEVPIPIDPVTGKDFEYRRDGAAASLTAPPPPGYPDVPPHRLHYEITLKR